MTAGPERLETRALLSAVPVFADFSSILPVVFQGDSLQLSAKLAAIPAGPAHGAAQALGAFAWMTLITGLLEDRSCCTDTALIGRWHVWKDLVAVELKLTMVTVHRPRHADMLGLFRAW